MSFWRFLAALFNGAWKVDRFFQNLGFNLGFFGGGILAIIVLAMTAGSMVGRILAGAIFVGCLLWGAIWDMRRWRK